MRAPLGVDPQAASVAWARAEARIVGERSPAPSTAVIETCSLSASDGRLDGGSRPGWNDPSSVGFLAAACWTRMAITKSWRFSGLGVARGSGGVGAR